MTLTLPRGDTKKIIWSIAGSDSSGGAGLQTDVKTITTLGGHACTVVTSVTAQSSGKVAGYQSVTPSLFSMQLQVMRDDLPPDAIKIGMLGDAECIGRLADFLAGISTHVIYDPVLVSSSGTRLMDDASMETMRRLLLPEIDILTPNLAEAEILSGHEIRSDADVERAASIILNSGVKAVFLKGWNSGHGFVQDFYKGPDATFWLTLPRSEKPIPRGTGCALASALATSRAYGYDEADSLVIAKTYVHQLIRNNHKLGAGPPMANHAPWPSGAVAVARSAEQSRQTNNFAVAVAHSAEPSRLIGAEDMPWLTRNAAAGRTLPIFPDCGAEPLGFYPIFDCASWMRRLLPLGIRTAQLRAKNMEADALAAEIDEAIATARVNDTRLFINDYWQQAIKARAYGVHLGQEDLDTADIAAIANAGLRLGISTHSYAELARALALNPSYIALGPVYPTTLKSMRFAPQGVETLSIWRSLTDVPLVAIGGIKLEQAQRMFEAGASSVAVVSDITQNLNPEARVKEWLALSPRVP